jgi:hypothetical protein
MSEQPPDGRALMAEVKRLRGLLAEFVADDDALRDNDYNQCPFCAIRIEAGSAGVERHTADCLVTRAHAALATEG